ncbi:PaaI family thioesterase [Alcanivorax hongdengensis]|uniref:PaaI family thioesterase n=1 Tax=Alcanivorax hongdengensis TaxID=519051 RepID=UPI0002E275F2|nr:PaaI family thioesterase [Alcanivorax hongdengensis]
MTKSSKEFTRLDICNRFLSSVRHSVVLGLEVVSAEEMQVRVRMPWREDLVGNPETGVMHGGAIFAMMDQAGGMAITCRTFPTFEITPTIDFRVDHLRGPAKGAAVICEASCYRLTTHVAFVRITTWEEGNDAEPIATGLATYTRMQIDSAGKVVA